MPIALESKPIFFYSQMQRIRRFEETLLENFQRGYFFGTTHTYIGQEANAVGVLSHLQESDIVFSNHRGHGHYLAYGGDVRALFAELMGRATGVCGGRGGSQHLKWKNFYSNGVQGGIVPVATGMALAEHHRDTRGIVVTFLGDGTLGEGVVYESLNMAALWSLPILYVVENNRIAQTTPIDLAVAGSIPDRFKAFGIPTIELATHDVQLIYNTCSGLINSLRATPFPQALILQTHRFGPHSKGDDTRDEKLLAEIREAHDPLALQAGRLDNKTRKQIESKINQEITRAFKTAINDPYPEITIL